MSVFVKVYSKTRTGLERPKGDTARNTGPTPKGILHEQGSWLHGQRHVLQSSA